MDHKNRVLITEIIVELHELYSRLERVDHAAGVDRVADLLGRLREVEGAMVRRGGGMGMWWPRAARPRHCDHG